MKHLWLLGMLGFVAGFPAFAAGEDDAERVRLVDEYFSYVPTRKMMNEMVDELAKKLPEEKRAEFVEVMKNRVRFEVIEAASKKSLAKHMSVPELRAFVDFVRRPEGRSAMDKMKYYMADVMPVAQQEVIRALREGPGTPAK